MQIYQSFAALHGTHLMGREDRYVVLVVVIGWTGMRVLTVAPFWVILPALNSTRYWLRVWAPVLPPNRKGGRDITVH
jgi:hypothetical protein